MSVISRDLGFATKRNFFLSLAITVSAIVMMVLMLMPFLSLSGGLLPLDMRLGYSVDEVNQLFTALGGPGRPLYSLFQLVDTVFPIALALTLMFSLVRIIGWVFEYTGHLSLIAFIPLGGAIADYVENILIATQLLSYPALSSLLITIASSFTTIKWGFMFVTILLVIILVILSL